MDRKGELNEGIMKLQVHSQNILHKLADGFYSFSLSTKVIEQKV